LPGLLALCGLFQIAFCTPLFLHASVEAKLYKRDPPTGYVHARLPFQYEGKEPLIKLLVERVGAGELSALPPEGHAAQAAGADHTPTASSSRKRSAKAEDTAEQPAKRYRKCLAKGKTVRVDPAVEMTLVLRFLDDAHFGVPANRSPRCTS